MDAKLCCIVVHGGRDTLYQVMMTIRRKTPVIIVNKSGPVANILAYAFENSDSLSTSSEENSPHDNDEKRYWIFH